MGKSIIMYTAGRYYTLRVNRTTDNGQYLINEEGDEVLLPNRYVTEEAGEGDVLDVFVYHDSEDRIVATTETPLAIAGEAAFLKVIDKTLHGAFLDWGLTKDLFLPAGNQTYRVEVGESYPVFIYTDNVTGRVTATARLNSFIKNTEIEVAPGDEVEILVAQSNETGFRVVVNNRNWGILYHNQIFEPLKIGDRLRAHVRRVTEDNRIDVSTHLQGYGEVKNAADKVMELVRSNGGRLPLNDESSPDEVRDVAGMSKKVFKRAAGFLMKKGALVMDENGISLNRR